MIRLDGDIGIVFGTVYDITEGRGKASGRMVSAHIFEARGDVNVLCWDKNRDDIKDIGVGKVVFMKVKIKDTCLSAISVKTSGWYKGTLDKKDVKVIISKDAVVKNTKGELSVKIAFNELKSEGWVKKTQTYKCNVTAASTLFAEYMPGDMALFVTTDEECVACALPV